MRFNAVGLSTGFFEVYAGKPTTTLEGVNQVWQQRNSVTLMRNGHEKHEPHESFHRLTLIVLVVESHWTEHSNNHLKNVDNSSKAECWKTESFEIIESCHPCSEFEIASKSTKACILTNFKEVIKCHVSGKTQRSCPKVKWIEERKYWIFEIAMFVLALTSYSIVYIRQRVLDRRVMLRIQKQLANGLVS